MLPDKIDIVKLPHHGSGKNTNKNFVRKYQMWYIWYISATARIQEY